MIKKLLYDGSIELFWATVMFVFLPISNIMEWIHWELYGKGPRNEK